LRIEATARQAYQEVEGRRRACLEVLLISRLTTNYREVAKQFPGVKIGAIRKAYNERMKGLCDTFSDEEVSQFKICY